MQCSSIVAMSRPALAQLDEVWPDADIALGKMTLPSRTRAASSYHRASADKELLLRKARKADIEIISDIELFARDAATPYVAITGSNGKSTVTTLLYHMGRAAGKETLGRRQSRRTGARSSRHCRSRICTSSNCPVSSCSGPSRYVPSCSSAAQCIARSPRLASQ